MNCFSNTKHCLYSTFRTTNFMNKMKRKSLTFYMFVRLLKDWMEFFPCFYSLLQYPLISKLPNFKKRVDFN